MLPYTQWSVMDNEVLYYSLYRFYGNDLCTIDYFVDQFIVNLSVAYDLARLEHTEE